MVDMIDSRRYVVITPVRDESHYLPFTIRSMVEQAIRPVEWVIVNDGSSDSTGEIIDSAVSKHSWIRAVHRKNRGYRKWGAGIMEAFYDGYNALHTKDWEFVAKLDGDLSFPPDYFQRALDKFEENPCLGIGGGFLYHMVNGEPVLERHPLFHVRGGAKIYRRACWKAIGRLWVGPGSDTLDEVKANMLGWESMSFIDAQIQHHRWTGETYGRWGGAVKNGKTDYVSGYHPLFLLAKAAKRAFEPPYLVGSCALVYGYVKAGIEGLPRVDDPELIRYLRSQQIAKLTGRETIWK